MAKDISIFNEDFFDRLSISKVKEILDSMSNQELKWLKDFGDTIRYYENRSLGFVGDNDEKYYKKPKGEFNPEIQEKIENDRGYIVNIYLFQYIPGNQIIDWIKDQDPITLKKIKDLSNAASDILDNRKGKQPGVQEFPRCRKQDWYRGRWIDHLRCGVFEDYKGLLVFRPNIGAVVYHGSDSFREGDLLDRATWFGSYDNSIQYIKIAGGGYMNLFRIKKSPRVLVLNDPRNLEYLFSIANSKQKEILRTTTGFGTNVLEKRDRSFGCVYQDKPRREFSRFSSREEDESLANMICSIPNIDGYIHPEVNYCEAGVAYRFEKPNPKAKRFFGELVLCKSGKYLERIGSRAVDCPKDAKDCDVDLNFWKKDFDTYLFDKDTSETTLLSKLKDIRDRF